MNDFKNNSCNTDFVKNNSGPHIGVVIAVVGMATCTIVLAKELNKNAEDKLRKY